MYEERNQLLHCIFYYSQHCSNKEISFAGSWNSKCYDKRYFCLLVDCVLELLHGVIIAVIVVFF